MVHRRRICQLHNLRATGHQPDNPNVKASIRPVDLSVDPEDEWASLPISMKVFGTASAANRPSRLPVPLLHPAAIVNRL